MRLIILVIVVAIAWFAYTNLGKPANFDSAVKDGTSKIKTEKTIGNVINRREGMAEEADAVTGGN